MSNCCNGCVHKDSFLGRDNKPRYYCELTTCILDKEGNGYQHCPLTIEQRDKLHANSEW